MNQSIHDLIRLRRTDLGQQRQKIIDETLLEFRHTLTAAIPNEMQQQLGLEVEMDSAQSGPCARFVLNQYSYTISPDNNPTVFHIVARNSADTDDAVEISAASDKVLEAIIDMAARLSL